MRMSGGKFDKKGKFQPVSWERAFDEMEAQFRKTYREKGPTGVSIFGSGQYTIPEGYAAAKLVKAGFCENKLNSSRHRIRRGARFCAAPTLPAKDVSV